MTKFMFLFTMIFIVRSAQSAVWSGNRDWQEKDLDAYSNWVELQVKDNIFSDSNSEYYGIKTDCADVMYALAIIYSFENNLNFTVKLRDGQSISNNVSDFDAQEDPLQRLKSFIHYVATYTSTYTLAKYNSLPLAINEIRAGDIYITSFKTNGQETNHAYLIKGIIETGHFELYSSTTPAKIRKLNVRKGYPLHVITGAPWGFKRVIPLPLIDHLKNRHEIYNNEQYEILSTIGDFMGHISKKIQTIADSFENNINFQIDNLCDMLTSRALEVKEAVAVLSNNNKCFKGSEFDLYSTPTRDSNIKNAFNRLLNGWKKIRQNSPEVGEQNYRNLEYILGKDKSETSRELLTKRCPIRVTDNVINLRDFFYLQYLGKISSNPNDPELTRWGLSTEKSSCKSQ